MGSITGVNLAAVDLNLLTILHAMFETGGTTAAARRLHVTQSAVSNALVRLRELFDDPLFVRSGRGLVPTPRCDQLRPLVEAAVARLEIALAPAAAFHPRTSTRRFSLACSDDHAFCEGPRLAAAFSAALPRTCLELVTIERLVAGDGLTTGEVDAAIGPRQAVPPGALSADLFVDRPVMVVRRDHPTIGDRFTRETFNAARHIQILVRGRSGGVGQDMAQKVMAEHGYTWTIGMMVPTFAAAAAAAAETDLVAGMSRRLAEALCRTMPLRIVDSPFEAAMRFDLVLSWHLRTDADPATRFAREVVMRALRAAGDGVARVSRAAPRRPRARARRGNA